MITAGDVYSIGRLGKTHALGGEIVFFCGDDVFDRVGAEYVFLRLEGLFVPFFIEGYRFQTDERVLIKFEGIDTREEASELTGAEVFFPRSLSDGAGDVLPLGALAGFVIHDDTTNSDTAPVCRVDTSTPNTLLELEDGRLVPLAPEQVRDIDKERKIIYMTLPEGLLSL
ncbi:MAG: 16S rRNA processing protein RimM [Prevotella sp.]|nr:16S rRNA processing protein RimM [Prevotella sp.]